MIKKLTSFAKVALLILSISFVANSCTTEEFYETYESPTDWYIKDFNIKSSEWIWDNQSKLFYVDKSLPDLSFDIYNDGAVIGYIYVGDEGKNEIMSILPYRGSGEIFERTWFDVSYDLKRTVRFYFQWSDYKNLRPNDQNYKITLIY